MEMPLSPPVQVLEFVDEDDAILPDTTSTDLVLREDAIRMRLSQSQDRLWHAMQKLRRATRSVTPAHQIRARPYEWIAGGIAVGIVFGWITAPRR